MAALALMFFGAAVIYSTLGGGAQMVAKYRFLAQGQAAARAKLHFAHGARFVGLRVHQAPDGSDVLCGRIGDQDGGAAGTGLVRFVSEGTVATTWTEQQQPEFEAIWARDCGSGAS